MRIVITSLIFILALAVPALAVDPQAAGISPLIDEGNAARQRGDWSAADAAYRRALDLATQQEHADWQYRAWFYIGLVKQMAAQVAGDDAAKRAMLEESLEPYRNALKFNPKTKSARINLAEVETFLGHHEAAVELLTEALAIEATPDVAEMLGDAHRVLGNRAEAALAYAVAAGKNADSVTVHEKQLAVLLDKEAPTPGPALTEYLWALNQRNQVDRALDAAAQALGHPALSREDGRAVLTMFAAALARKDYDAAAFEASGAAARIQALIAARSPHAPALKGLVDAYRGEIDDDDDFEAWVDSRPVGPPSAGYPLPIDAFRAVLRSIAQTSHSKPKDVNAAAYYKLALALDKANVDPASVRGLASIYASEGNYKKLSSLDREYQEPMAAREATPAEAEDVYEYFRLMGRVKTSQEPDSAEGLQQFEQAKMAGAGGIVEPELYEHLSDIYEKRGDTGKSNSERFSAAAAYMERGNFTLAREAIAELGHARPDGVDGDDYRRMVLKLVYLPKSVEEMVPPEKHFTVKRNVLLICAGGARDDRVKATAELKGLGIAVDTKQHDLLISARKGRVLRTHFFLPVAPSTMNAEKPNAASQ
jgi:tetratricopeptide (TPR) repeat protein